MPKRAVDQPRPLRPALAALAWALALLLPTGSAAADSEPLFEHRIEVGDTLIGLRGRVIEPAADWRRLQRLNRISNPQRLQPGSLLRIPVSMLLAQPETAEVVYVQGQVTVQRGSQPAQPLAGGATVAGGDRLVSAAQSSAVLRLADGSRLLLRPESAIQLEQLMRLGSSGRRDTRLRLDSGAADVQVPSAPPQAPPRHRLEMRTPVVNLAVRGTEFRASAEAQAARLEVLEGNVAAGRTAVLQGFGTLATPSGVGTPRPLPAPPQLAPLTEPIGRLPLELAWTAQPDAVGYRAQVVEAGPPGRLLLEGRFAEPRASWLEDLPDGRYELRVRSADAQGLEGRDAVAPFVLKARPEAPFVVEPAPDSQGQAEQVRFRWSLNPSANRYHLQVASDEAFQNLVAEQRSLEGGQAQEALPLGSVFWRVRSIRGSDDAGPWSAVQRYTRVPPPPPAAPPPSLPAQASDDGLRVGWVTRNEPGLRYQVQAAREPTFAQLLGEQTTSDATWLLPAPEPGTVFVRVRSIGADGRAGPWGATQSIEVPRRLPWWLWLLPLLLVL